MIGKLVVFEGCEGSGKSTQLRLLSQFLTERGVDFILTREPGGSKISEEIRKIILDGKNTEMCDECEAVIPALNSGKIVICDRYYYSSLAYQGYARGLGEQFVADINSFAIDNYPPYMTVFLDISPEDAFNRKHGADKNDRIEQLGLAFHRKVYEGYKALEAKYPDICAVDCSGTKAQTAEKIRNLFIERRVTEQ